MVCTNNHVYKGSLNNIECTVCNSIKEKDELLFFSSLDANSNTSKNTSNSNQNSKKSISNETPTHRK